MMYHHNVIPPSYRSWREVWQSASTIHLPGNKMFVVNNDTDTWIIDIDYIKARCFEEIEPNLPTVGEVGCYIALEERALPHPWLVSLGRKLKVLSTQL